MTGKLVLCAVLALAGAARHAAAALAGAAAGGSSASPAPPLDLGQIERKVPNPARGRALYAVCADCHGRQGVGTVDGTVPAIAGQLVRVIRKQLVDFRSDRRWDIRMQAVAGRHGLATAQDVADVSAYVANMRRPAITSVGDGQFVRLGERLYGARCARCHGPGGAGSNARMIPRVAGQQYQYLLRQLHDALEGRRPNMAAAHARPLAQLEVSGLDGLADYISRLAVRVTHSTQPTSLETVAP
ncbi:MAG TPA: c-type cytochrome [Steroidobacteraceae bacterium]|nr:c-type cytochrome [Steroidobacteraceae bacterium]